MKNTDQDTIKSNGQVNPEKDLKQPENKPKLSRLDKGILTVAAAYPEATKAEIVNRTVELGIAQHKPTVYKRLAKCSYLSLPLSEIENHHQQEMVREDYPLARVRLRKALNDKGISHKEALPFIKLIYDKVHGQKYTTTVPEVVHIESIKNAQFILQADLE